MEEQQSALTDEQVARRYGLKTATLRAWRLRGQGPRFVRLGRAVRYLVEDVEDFLRSSRVEPGAPQDGTASDSRR